MSDLHLNGHLTLRCNPKGGRTHRSRILGAVAGAALLSVASSTMVAAQTADFSDPAKTNTSTTVPAPTEPDSAITELKEPEPETISEAVDLELLEPMQKVEGPELKEPAPLVNSANSSGEKSTSVDGISCTGTGTCMVDATGLPLRVLPRSFAKIYEEKDVSGEILSNAASAFKPTFVFAREDIDLSDPVDPKGWYKIGYTKRFGIGWMQAKDLVEWRQALLMEYTHPGKGTDRRNPVLMFADLEPLQALVSSNNRKDEVTRLQEAIQSGNKPDIVIGREPANFLDIDEVLYLLPIMEWEDAELLDVEEPTHYLQVFAAVPGERAESAGEGTLIDEDYLKEELSQVEGPLNVDIVFVMDMTGSMQPYIDRVRDGMKEIVQQLTRASRETQASIRFGLIGYRDSASVTPELGWTTKDFTPTLVDGGRINEILDTEAKAAKVSSDEWAEDVHGGVKAGINAAWRNEDGHESQRIMILVGDASGHSMSSPTRKTKNSAGMSAADLNELAIGKGIYTFSVYLEDKRAEPDWKFGKKQFSDFGRNRNDSAQGSIPIKTENSDSLQETAKYIGKTMVKMIQFKESGDVDAIREFTKETEHPTNAETGGSPVSAQMIKTARGVMQAAMVDYLGNDTVPPKDFISWVYDADMVDVTRAAMTVRVMITREQFDNIIGQSERLLDAIVNSSVGNIDFLKSLKMVSATTSLGEDIKANQSLGQQQYLPKWISALPYKSKVLAMTPSKFENLTTSERDQFRANLASKIAAYREISASVNRWIKLEETDNELQEIVALRLTLLP